MPQLRLFCLLPLQNGNMRRGSFGGQGMQALTRGTWPALSRLAIQTSGSGNAPSQLKPVEAEKSNAVDRCHLSFKPDLK